MWRLGLVVALAFATSASAHSGGLNSQGCHNNRKTGDYHCHRAAAPASQGPAVKLSRSGICHAKGSTYYNRTYTFTAYPSLAACQAAGGRLPRG